MNGSILAIKITSDDIKIVEIGQENGETIIRGMRHFQSGDTPPADVSEAIGKLLKEQKPRTLNTLLVMNSQEIDYRDFSFPFNSSRKVSRAINFEVSSEYPLEDHVVTHIESVTRDPGKKSFLAAIARKDALSRRIKESEDAGLQIIGITSDLSILGNYFRKEPEALVMEMGERQTLFALFVHGVPVLTRDVPIGIKQFIGGGGDPESQDLRALAGEIKRTIHSFNARTGLSLKKVHVSGNILAHREIIDALRNSLEVDFVDQLPEMTAFKLEKGSGKVNQYASLLGVAEWKRKNNSFNFFKDKFFKAQPQAIQRSYLRWGSIALLSILITVFVSMWLNMSLLERRKVFLSAETKKTFLTAFPQTKRIVDEVKQARNFLDIRKSELGRGTASSEIALLDILETISRTIPGQTSFEIRNLFWEKGKLEIDGKTDSFKTVNGIQELLSGLNEFSEVTISNAKSVNEGQNVEFKITFRLAG